MAGSLATDSRNIDSANANRAFGKDRMSFYATNLFRCKDKHHWNCIPPVVWPSGETFRR